MTEIHPLDGSYPRLCAEVMTAILGRLGDLTPSGVLGAVCYVLEIEPGEVLGPRRFPHLVAARQLTAYALRRYFGLSYPRIGRLLGGRDHTTIIHACRSVERALLEATA